MTQEDKELLLKDLCARLPYKPIVQILNLEKLDKGQYNEYLSPSKLMNMRVFEIKPYLRPMSSMTEEESLEFVKTVFHTDSGSFWSTDSYDWLNSHHFDYRGLIEKGLALEAPEGMYIFYNKNEDNE